MAQRERILPPYTQRVDDMRHRIVKLVGVTSLISLAMVMGFFIAIFGLYGWFIPVIPIVILTLLALWIAPDVDAHLDIPIQKLILLYFGLLLVWPKYLALNAPGLPWISFQRLCMFALAAVFFYAISTSSRMRGEIKELLTADKWMFRFFMVWIFVHAVMWVVSTFSATSRFVDDTLTWHLFFIMTAWVMVRQGLPSKLCRMLIICFAITTVVVIPENMYMKPIWTDYIPAFLSVDPIVMESLMDPTLRFDEYRVRSIFTNSLVYSEYLGMLLPFVLLAISWNRGPFRVVAALALVLLVIIVGTWTQARTAMVVVVATIPAFVGLYVIRRYRVTRHQRDIVAPALVMAFPAAAAVGFSVIMASTRLRTMVLGGGQHQNSNDARAGQWDMALTQFVKNPFGYGLGTIQEKVPFYIGSKFTIDSYPINLLIETGLLGLIAFAGFFATAIIVGAKAYVQADSRDEQIAGAAAIGLVAFVLARLVLSTEAGQGLAFGYAGIILGIYYRQMRRAAGRKAVDA